VYEESPRKDWLTQVHLEKWALNSSSSSSITFVGGSGVNGSGKER